MSKLPECTCDDQCVLGCPCLLHYATEREAHKVLGIGTCQQCGRYTTDRYCYATDGCKELGGADVL